MVPVAASARRSAPASRKPGSLGGHGGRGRWRWSPTVDAPSEIAYAATGGEAATLPTSVLDHHRDRRRHLEHHLEEGNRRWGSLSARLRPVVRGARWSAWGTRTDLRSRARFRDGLRREANPKAGGAILLERDGLRFLRRRKKKKKLTATKNDRHTGANGSLRA